jgi:type VI secretion system protein ImpM
LNDRWQQAFLTAPVWRFWLGAGICGSAVAGAIMPSLDGMGRYYPLTLHAVADAGAPIPPPDVDTQDEWYGMAESFLLSTLARDSVFEDISSALDALAVPRTRLRAAGDARIASLTDDMAGMIAASGDFATSLSALSAASPEVYAAASFWWTAGGGDFPPTVLGCRGLPDPYHYSTLLTGDLGGAVNAR